MKYRKKPVVIEAVQFKEDDPSTHTHVNFSEPGANSASPLYGEFWVRTLEGPLKVTEGDWIVTGIKGEHYLYKPDIFEATYDPVND